MEVNSKVPLWVYHSENYQAVAVSGRIKFGLNTRAFVEIGQQLKSAESFDHYIPSAV